MSRVAAILSGVLFVALGLSAQAADILVADAYARAVPPGQPNSAVFMSLENSGDQDRALVGAESAVADAVELHTHLDEGGMMRMRRVEQIELPAGATVELKPGGLHVMLIGLTATLEPGMTVPLTLIYDDGSRTQVEAPVRKITMTPMMH